MQACSNLLAPNEAATLGDLAAKKPDKMRRILQAIVSDIDAMDTVASDIPPACEPVTDYITELETRRALFDQFRALAREDELPNAAILAVFLVAPVDEIRLFLARDPQPPNIATQWDIGFLGASEAVRAYFPKFQQPESSTLPLMTVPSAILNEPGMPVSSSSVTRSGFADRVKDRDGHVCVFSSTSDPAAAHIFPYSTIKHRNFGRINMILTQFWGPEKSMAWRRIFEDAGISNSPKNGISMSHQIHFWFDNAKFALKPLRQTPEGIVVQWHWLKESILKPLVHIRPNDDILLQAGVTDQNWGKGLIAHRESGVRIQTGQTFLLRRHEEMPSWELLELHWDLLRVAAICGAADVTDDYYYDYGDRDERGYDEVVAAKQRAIAARQANANEGDDSGNSDGGDGFHKGGSKDRRG
ncbi:uncharacterized protein P884DRAFT_264956 [Thermothelomyces heterothallicus CBS 202.75]|uniref:uncharacterized protein n=1 Tax=Thermothelomyces heterothallicus CBS 202.75 TaxID=1149848 RepID=UPI003743B3EC